LDAVEAKIEAGGCGSRMYSQHSCREGERRCVVEEVRSFEGPVLKIDGELVLLIPLEPGGCERTDGSRRISDMEGPHLKVVIPEWIAGMLRIEAGDLVCVSNLDEKFHIQGSSPRPAH